jgi:glycolate oxidase
MESLMGPGSVLYKPVDLRVYDYDASLERALPDLVCFPTITEHVVEIVKMAHRDHIPFTARGAGTNLSGGTLLVRGGIVIETSRMNRILEIDVRNQRAVVQPGVVNLDLVNEAAKQGLLYAPDPASQKASTIGGNIGENAGGPHCLKYGVTTNHVLGLEVVTSDGELLQLGGKALDAPGYDLTGVFVGSEGTFGVATKITVRLIRPPEAIKTMLAVFNSIEDAGETVSAIIAAGIIPATLEMMDKLIIRAIEESFHSGFPLDAEAVLIIEIDGLKDGLERLAEQIKDICHRNNVREVRTAANEAERAQLWAGRRGAFGAIARLSPNYLIFDGTVPRTELPRVLREALKLGQQYGLRIGNVFHAGDGNLHPNILFDERYPDQVLAAKTIGTEIMRLCAAAGGTISGEHGVGVEKADFMNLIFTEEDMKAMKAIMRAFDPQNICNPGKVFPVDHVSEI